MQPVEDKEVMRDREQSVLDAIVAKALCFVGEKSGCRAFPQNGAAVRHGGGFIDVIFATDGLIGRCVIDEGRAYELMQQGELDRFLDWEFRAIDGKFHAQSGVMRAIGDWERANRN